MISLNDKKKSKIKNRVLALQVIANTPVPAGLFASMKGALNAIFSLLWLPLHCTSQIPTVSKQQQQQGTVCSEPSALKPLYLQYHFFHVCLIFPPIYYLSFIFVFGIRQLINMLIIAPACASHCFVMSAASLTCCYYPQSFSTRF